MDSDDVRRQWAERSGEYSPEYYAYYGPDETSEAVRRSLEASLDRGAAVLELGCSSGRHLAHLRDHGFENLAGVELNEAAFDVMAETYPGLAETGEFYAAAIEDVVEEFEDGRFEAVFSVETLQHLHPDAEWVYDEVARITDDLLVTAENEGDGDGNSEGDGERDGDTGPGSAGQDVSYVNDEFPLYHRDWNAVFTERGFRQVDVRSGRRDTVRTFRKP